MLRSNNPRGPLAALATTEALIWGIALANFVLVYKWAHEMGGICWICPWYYPWRFPNEPSMLLVAASGLWVSRWRFTKWPGRLLALGGSAPIVYFGYLSLLSVLKNRHWIDSVEVWRMIGIADSQIFQYVLGLVIFCRPLSNLIRQIWSCRTYKSIRV